MKIYQKQKRKLDINFVSGIMKSKEDNVKDFNEIKRKT